MRKRAAASSNLASVGDNSETGLLKIEFVDGSVYRYCDVPENVCDLREGSKGRLLSARDPYPFSRVG